jgi:hypothetical protein
MLLEELPSCGLHFAYPFPSLSAGLDMNECEKESTRESGFVRLVILDQTGNWIIPYPYGQNVSWAVCVVCYRMMVVDGRWGTFWVGG